MAQIRPPKERKDRTKGQDLCPYCLSFGCDGVNMSPKFERKMRKRREQGLCPSCGHQPCRCKSGDRLWDVSKWDKAKVESKKKR